MRVDSSLVGAIVLVVAVFDTHVLLIVGGLLDFFLGAVHHLVFHLGSELLLLLGEDLLFSEMSVLVGRTLVINHITAFLVPVFVLLVLVEAHQHHFSAKLLLFLLG